MVEILPTELADNLVEFCENRGRVYSLLSRCYEAEVDAGFAAAFARSAALDSDDGRLVDAFASLQADLAGCDEDGLEQLAVAFDRAFFGMGPRAAQKAFPYESVYTSPRGLMMQEAYNQVVSLYRAASFQKSPDFAEPEDHVAVELAFMARLCERAVGALREGDGASAEAVLRDQLAFLREHLLNWIDRFAADLHAAAEGGFYADLAAFTTAYLRADSVALEEVVE